MYTVFPDSNLFVAVWLRAKFPVVNYGENPRNRQFNIVCKLLSTKVVIVEFIDAFYSYDGGTWCPLGNEPDGNPLLFHQPERQGWTSSVSSDFDCCRTLKYIVPGLSSQKPRAEMPKFCVTRLSPSRRKWPRPRSRGVAV